MNFHFYHLVSMSPWPYVGSIFAFYLLYSLLLWFNYKFFFFLGWIMLLFLLSYQWWRDVVRESGRQGGHSCLVVFGLKLGMALFILSEVFFFFSFFWSYYHFGLSPVIELGQWWPPLSILSFNPMNVPFLNTLILLSSGVSVTWCHHCLNMSYQTTSVVSMVLTVFLGCYFTFLQYMEYSESYFGVSDSSYGSIFFMATGFHGLHVLLGTSFLSICLFRMVFFHFSSLHLFGFEAAAWYWHFVDVVWLFLYVSVYWWGW